MNTTPRAMLPKGSPEWTSRTLGRLRWALAQKNITEDEFNKILSELDRFEVWKTYPPDGPYGSKETMLYTELDCTEDEARKQCQLNPPGVKRHDITGRASTSAPIGRSTKYQLARLDRDNPEIKARLDAGEIPSIQQAALAAGIIKPSFRCPTDPKGAARRIKRHLSGEQLAELIRLLSSDAASPATALPPEAPA